MGYRDEVICDRRNECKDPSGCQYYKPYGPGGQEMHGVYCHEAKDKVNIIPHSALDEDDPNTMFKRKKPWK